MTDNDFEELIASHPLVAKDVDAIRTQLRVLKKLAIAEIKAEVPNFWGRITDSFSLPANSTTPVNMRHYFPSYDYAMYFWTADQMLEKMDEGEYARDHPDGISSVGKPTIFIPKADYKVQFAPVNNVATTINVIYMTKTSDFSMASVPDRWDYVPMYHVLSFYDKPDVREYRYRYENALATMKKMAKESIDEQIKLVLDSFYVTMNAVQEAHRRR